MPDDRFNVDPGPDPRAVAFLEGKGLKRSWRWTSMWQTEHAYAFTLAGVYRLDVLAGAKQLVTDSIAQGDTLEGFKSDFVNRMKALGFDGPQIEAGHPEGPRDVNLTANWRIRTIYDTNTRQAYAAASWQAYEDTSADFPALTYHHTPQEHPRLFHLKWDGITLPISHVFWRTHFTPNGWFCKCFTTQVSVHQLAGGGVKLTTSAELAARGYDPDPAHWPVFIDRRTGRQAHVPEGIDPGFAYNAGLTRRENLADLVYRRAASLDPDMARAAAFDLPNLPEFADMAADGVRLGQARADAAARALAHLKGSSATQTERNQAAGEAADGVGDFETRPWPVGFAPLEIRGLSRDGSGLVVVNQSGIGHSADRHPTVPADWRRVQLLLEQGEVWRSEGGDLTLFGRFAGPEGERTWSLALKPVDGAWRVKTLFASSPRRQASATRRLQQVRGGRGVIDFTS